MAGCSGRLPAGLGVSTDPRRAAACHRLSVSRRAALPARLPVCPARRRNPVPRRGPLFVRDADVYAWRATDEQAVCASWIGKHAEAFTLCRRLLARPDIPDADRQRIAANRDFSVPAMIEAAVIVPRRPGAVPGRRSRRGRGHRQPGRRTGPPDHRADHQLVSDTAASMCHGSGASWCSTPACPPPTARSCGNVTDFSSSPVAAPATSPPPSSRSSALRSTDGSGCTWAQGWRFFAPENYITRLTAVLDAEPQVFQVGINFADAAKLTGASAAEQAVRRAPDAGRYLLTEAMASGPAMFDTARLDRAGGMIAGCALRAWTRCSASPPSIRPETGRIWPCPTHRQSASSAPRSA